MKIKPILDKILVEYEEPKDRTDGGILLPGVSKKRPTTAVVLAVGPGKPKDNGTIPPMPVKVGDKVLVAMSGEELHGLGKKIRVVAALDILGVKK